jgi:hypothetical protein
VFLLAAVLLGVVTVPLCGGRIGALADVRLRMVPLLFTALIVQILVTSVVTDWNDTLLRALHLGTYAVLLFVLWANRRIPGMWVIAAGAALNLAAIVANVGVMPSSRSAVRSAGLAADPDGFVNSGVLEHPRLLFLGDIWAIPKGWPLANVFSIGDVVIAIGVFVAVHAICGSRIIPSRFRAHTGVTEADGVCQPDAGITATAD